MPNPSAPVSPSCLPYRRRIPGRAPRPISLPALVGAHSFLHLFPSWDRNEYQPQTKSICFLPASASPAAHVRYTRVSSECKTHTAPHLASSMGSRELRAPGALPRARSLAVSAAPAVTTAPFVPPAHASTRSQFFITPISLVCADERREAPTARQRRGGRRGEEESRAAGAARGDSLPGGFVPWLHQVRGATKTPLHHLVYKQSFGGSWGSGDTVFVPGYLLEELPGAAMLRSWLQPLPVPLFWLHLGHVPSEDLLAPIQCFK